MFKPVLVTGASSGIGEATAVHLAHKGFKVFAGARRREKLDDLRAVAEGTITPVTLDVTESDSINAVMREIESHGAPLYGLVNNAGISVTGPLENIPVEEWRRQFETNVFGLVAMTQAVLPAMRAQGAGRIVNVGSVAGRIASPFMPAYAASKHAVEGLSDSLRREVAPFGIKVSVIRPGFINTPFGEQEQDGFVQYAKENGPYAAALDEFRAWHAKGHPDGASPHDVAIAIADALTAERPNSRYTVPAQYLGSLAMRNLLPSAIVDRVFERVTGVYKANSKMQGTKK